MKMAAMRGAIIVQSPLISDIITMHVRGTLATDAKNAPMPSRAYAIGCTTRPGNSA